MASSFGRGKVYILFSYCVTSLLPQCPPWQIRDHRKHSSWTKKAGTGGAASNGSQAGLHQLMFWRSTWRRTPPVDKSGISSARWRQPRWARSQVRSLTSFAYFLNIIYLEKKSIISQSDRRDIAFLLLSALLRHLTRDQCSSSWGDPFAFLACVLASSIMNISKNGWAKKHCYNNSLKKKHCKNNFIRKKAL